MAYSRFLMYWKRYTNPLKSFIFFYDLFQNSNFTDFQSDGQPVIDQLDHQLLQSAFLVPREAVQSRYQGRLHVQQQGIGQPLHGLPTASHRAPRARTKRPMEVSLYRAGP